MNPHPLLQNQQGFRARWRHRLCSRAGLYLLVAIPMLVAAIWAGFIFPWGTDHEFLKGREKWMNKPALGNKAEKEKGEIAKLGNKAEKGKGEIAKLEVNDEKWTEVLIKLFEQNREEIRFWQAHLFTVSLGFDTVILAIVALGLRIRQFTDMHRCVFIGGCLFLCVSYLFFLRFVDGAIAVNDHDLIGIQFGLRLSEQGRYLEGQAIYKEGPSPGQSHIWKLALFNLGLVISSVVVLAFWRIRCKQQQPNQDPAVHPVGTAPPSGEGGQG